MSQDDTEVKFERMPGSGLRMRAGGGWAWAFVDWQDNVIKVPVIQDVGRGLIEKALSVYWPTITTILWPDDLDVLVPRWMTAATQGENPVDESARDGCR